MILEFKTMETLKQEGAETKAKLAEAESRLMESEIKLLHLMFCISKGAAWDGMKAEMDVNPIYFRKVMDEMDDYVHGRWMEGDFVTRAEVEECERNAAGMDPSSTADQILGEDDGHQEPSRY